MMQFFAESNLQQVPNDYCKLFSFFLVTCAAHATGNSCIGQYYQIPLQFFAGCFRNVTVDELSSEVRALDIPFFWSHTFVIETQNTK